MKYVKVKLFAAARDLASTREIELELLPTATVKDLKQCILELHPNLAPLLEHARLAVNCEFALDDTFLEEGDEIALIPPVSGG